ncbi:GTP-binding protein [Paenibacillus tritici]|uniref:GTP-binding protein n=1 Tax=Paenibacillus tritici TaxID=1873425 RepID=A0ABX2DZ04_9BACL|nr:GTP-binding protein [Paenibacillus tritici]NQX49837.1 GTP-binding protein [Paenibacillus tritici]QUL56929.1 GTP-binding protein [Paenibacillus tritici]
MKIPVIILSGFLGSGKTTLLLSLLKESKLRGLNPGVVMNELGKKDVDGYILQESTGTRVEKLLDGCICCSRKEELPRTLTALLARRPDIIYIELTGVADPDEIAKSLLAPPLADRLSLHHTVTVLDAENALEYSSRFSSDKQLVRTLRKQIATADLIIVNKSDLVEPETLWKIEKMVSKQNSESEIVFTHYSQINLAPLLAGIVVRGLNSPALRRGSGNVNVSGTALQRMNTSGGSATAVHEPAAGTDGSYSQVAAVTLTVPAAWSGGLRREQLEEFFRQWGYSLLRAKGHVRLAGQDSVQLVQLAGNRISWEASSYPGQPYVVCIGLNLDEKAISRSWASLFS